VSHVWLASVPTGLGELPSYWTPRQTSCWLTIARFSSRAGCLVLDNSTYPNNCDLYLHPYKILLGILQSYMAAESKGLGVRIGRLILMEDGC
jgi:hypothetical protein